MFIELTERESVGEELGRLVGIDEHVRLRIGAEVDTRRLSYLGDRGGISSPEGKTPASISCCIGRDGPDLIRPISTQPLRPEPVTGTRTCAPGSIAPDSINAARPANAAADVASQ